MAKRLTTKAKRLNKLIKIVYNHYLANDVLYPAEKNYMAWVSLKDREDFFNR